jgi:hypothetical protein
MLRAELGDLLRLLLDSGRITEAEALDILDLFDGGLLDPSDLPLPLAAAPGAITGIEAARAIADVSLLVPPAQSISLLALATQYGVLPRLVSAVGSAAAPGAPGAPRGQVTASTPPAVKTVIRERLRNHFRGDFENTMAQYATKVAKDGNVAAWHKGMQNEVRGYIARQMTAGLGRPLTAEEMARVNQMASLQQSYLYRYAGDISAHQAVGKPYTEAYLTSRSTMYAGSGWEMWHRGNESVEARGDGYIVNYRAVDDRGTCSPCLNAQNNGPYLPNEGPFPGTICLGRGKCRCERHVVYDPSRWRQLLSSPRPAPQPPLQPAVPRSQPVAPRNAPVAPTRPAQPPVPTVAPTRPTQPPVASQAQAQAQNQTQGQPGPRQITVPAALTPQKLQGAWVNGSNNQKSIVLKTAVRDEFGVRGIMMNRNGYEPPARAVEAARVSARAMYDATQAELRRQGITEVSLYRGVKTEVRTPGIMESWSTDQKTAKKFDGHDVLEEKIPAGRIMMYSGGPGWQNGKYKEQYEYVVLSEEPRK